MYWHLSYFTVFPLLPGAWRTAAEEWGTEDWNEDVSIPGSLLTSAFYPLVVFRDRKWVYFYPFKIHP